MRSGISPRLGARRARPVTVGLFPPVFANTPEREGGAAREDRRQQRPTPGLRLSENALEMAPGAVLGWISSEIDVVAHEVCEVRDRTPPRVEQV